MKLTGQPILEDCSLADLPNTVSYAIMYRLRIDSFSELPKEKKPPRNLWDKPYRLSKFFDAIFKTPSSSSGDDYEFNSEEVE